MTDILRSAIWYAQRMNWPVFPVHNPIFGDDGVATGCTCEEWIRANRDPEYKCPESGRGKCPRCKWMDRSTTDIDQICKWFSRPWRSVNVDTGEILYVTPNIGIDCGKADLLVFDCDSYKETCGDLSDWLTIAEQETVTVSTPSGGEHLIYRREGKPYGNSTKGLPAGIDIRGLGGYIVAAPSIGRTNRRYQYAEGYGPHECPLFPIPPALDEILSNCTTIKCGGTVQTDSAAVRRSAELVMDVLDRGDIDYPEPEDYQGGLRWTLKHCPFMPEDDPHGDDSAAWVIVLANGAITAGCHHNRCQKLVEGYAEFDDSAKGWGMLKLLTGYSTATVDVFGGAL